MRPIKLATSSKKILSNTRGTSDGLHLLYGRQEADLRRNRAHEPVAQEKQLLQLGQRGDGRDGALKLVVVQVPDVLRGEKVGK